jgi:hypothetical protein
MSFNILNQVSLLLAFLNVIFSQLTPLLLLYYWFDSI